MLKLSCGGIAVLSPWAGGVGSLAVVSASGLVTPPVYSKSSDQDSNRKHASVLKFVNQAVEKSLKVSQFFFVSKVLIYICETMKLTVYLR